MDDIKRANVRTLMRVLQAIEEEVLKLLEDKERRVETKPLSSDATGDLEEALRGISHALDKMQSAIGDREDIEQPIEPPWA